jgi:dynein heavy chain 1
MSPQKEKSHHVHHESRIPEVPSSLGLTRQQKQLVGELIKLPAFSKLLTHMEQNTDAWTKYLHSTASHTNTSADEDAEKAAQHKAAIEAELYPPTSWEAGSYPKHVTHWHAMLIARAIRADRLPLTTNNFINSIFGADFISHSQVNVDLMQLVKQDSVASSPLLLVSRPGFDASSKVDQLAIAMNMAKGYEVSFQ